MLTAGTKLGPYEIVAPLGAGGMGEVYRARDTRLKREVAVKVLRTGRAGDEAELLRRLEQEARTIAGLNHPNLVAIHDVGVHNGAPFLVMELLKGETLRARMQPGPMPWRRATENARQLAQGLAAAHAAGVVHRDLKPENIMLTPEGRVKILDFGLARAVETRSGTRSGNDAETLAETSPALATAAGAVMGTVGYMAPEQVRGEAAGPAADIFAFGAILYEMVAGRRAFQAPTSAETMTAILREEPPELAAEGSAAAVPAGLDRILRRCLEKHPAQRFQSAADLDFALAAVAGAATGSSASHGQVRPTTGKKARGGRTPLWIALTAVAAVAVCALFMLDRDAPMLASATVRTLTTHGEAKGHFPVWSPAGDAVAYGASANNGGVKQVYEYRLGSSTPVALTHMPEDAIPLAWSQDGREIIFSEDQFNAPTVWSVAAVGGEPQKLADLGRPVGGAQGLAAHGNELAAVMPQPDGKLGVAYTTGKGGSLRWYEPAPFAATALVDFPSLDFSTDGSELLLAMPETQGATRTWILPFPPAAGQSPRAVLGNLPRHDFLRMCWMPDGRNVLVSAGVLPRDSTVWEASPGSGRMRMLVGSGTSAYLARLSPRGNALAMVQAYLNYRVVSADVHTAAVTPLIASAHKATMPAWANAAPELAYVTDRDGGDEIWLHSPVAEGDGERLLVGRAQMGGAGIYFDPAPSPHGRRVAFTFSPTVVGSAPQPQTLWLGSVAGGPPVPLTAPTTDSQFFPAWSPGGDRIAYLSIAGPTSRLCVVATSGGAAPRTLVPEVASFNQSDSGPAWSRDGRWIAYAGTDALVHVIAPDGSGGRLLTRTPLTAWTFSADSGSLYGAVAHGQTADLVSVSLASGAVTLIGSLGDRVPGSWFLPGIHMTLSPDGRSVTYNTGLSEDDMDLVQPFAPYGGGMARVRHWLHFP